MRKRGLRTGVVSSYLPDAYRKQLSTQRVAMAMKMYGWVQLFEGKRVVHGNERLRLRRKPHRSGDAVLYEQMGQGKKLVDAYHEVKSAPIGSYDDGPTRAEYQPAGRQR